MLQVPLAVGVGHVLKGTMLFEANESRGYNVHMTLINANTAVQQSNVIVTQCALHHFQYTTQQASSYGYGASAMPSSSQTADVENSLASQTIS